MKERIFSMLLILLTALLEAQVNLDFEQTSAGAITASNGVMGWTLQSAPNASVNGACGSATYTNWSSTISEVSVVSTPVFGHPYIGTINHSPLGGNKVLQMNDLSGTNNVSRAITSFVVTHSNNAFDFALNGAWEGADYCCGQPFFRLDVLDCQGNMIPSKSFNCIPAGNICSGAGPSWGFFQTGQVCWWPTWKTGTIDLSSLTGSCVTIVITNGDCYQGGHHGQMFFDAQTRPSQIFSYSTGEELDPYS